jgi:diguanylate cyclase (GGDEF)-like protein
MVSFLRVLLGRPRLLNGTLAPVAALATTLVVSALGIRGLVTGADALQSALSSAGSAHELETIAAGVQGINGNLYHVLSLRGAQTKGFNAAAELHPLLAESDRVAGLLVAWRDGRATPAQRPRVNALIASVRRYRGAVDFVSQMLDVDFVAAVSFMQPFDQNFHDLTQSVTALVREVQARQRADADDALTRSATTIKAFEGVGLSAVLVALLAAANMGRAMVRAHRLARQNNALTRLTQLDALTGLGNRRCFDEALEGAWADCTAKQAPLTLIMFDVDNFKKFNDSQGHQAGDACLRQVAAAVAPCTRGLTDTAARYGGEEFAIILPDAALEAGRAVAERVRLAVAGCAIAHPAAGPPGIVTVSLGVATMVPTVGFAPAALIERADQGVYAAKRGGRNRIGETAADARQVSPGGIMSEPVLATEHHEC